jgi:hypothetical protein
MPAPKDPVKYVEWYNKVELAKKNRGPSPLRGRKQPASQIAKRMKKIKANHSRPEWKAKMSAIAKQSGFGKWMKGKKAPGVTKANARRKGKTYKELYGKNWKLEIEKRRKGNQIRWVGKRKKQRDKHNGEARYRRWRTRVFKRDEYTCQMCNKHGGELNAHHIYSWSKYPDFRYKTHNGVTLCKPCHRIVHRCPKH